MNILLIVNKPSAKRVSVLVRLSGKDQQKKLKVLMDEKRFREAFDLVCSQAEPEKYLDPRKECSIKAPEYTLVEDMIARAEVTEASLS